MRWNPSLSQKPAEWILLLWTRVLSISKNNLQKPIVHLCFSTQIWWVYWQPLWQNTWDLKHWRGLKENRCFRICYSVGISVIRQFTIVSLSWEREKRVFPPSSLWSHVQLPSKWSGTVGEGECGAYSSMDREYAHGSEIMILPRANLQDNIYQLSIHLCIAIFSFLIM